MQKCSNCGSNNHHFRQCTQPIASYGVIAFRHKNPLWNQTILLSDNDSYTSALHTDEFEYLLIQRSSSIGFIEIVRGKYKMNDYLYIQDQIHGMTQEERDFILINDFHSLWTRVWGTNENKNYRQDYENSKLKFEQFHHGYEDPDSHKIYTWKLFTDLANPAWPTPEWGFPKGRKNHFESDFDCALREFEEETGLRRNQFRVFENIQPIAETFYGDNNVFYTHIYYLGWVPHCVKVELQEENEHMKREIGNIGWFSYEKALEKIRPTNKEKRDILQRANQILQHVSPMLVGPVLHSVQNSIFGNSSPW